MQLQGFTAEFQLLFLVSALLCLHGQLQIVKLDSLVAPAFEVVALQLVKLLGLRLLAIEVLFLTLRLLFDALQVLLVTLVFALPQLFLVLARAVCVLVLQVVRGD